MARGVVTSEKAIPPPTGEEGSSLITSYTYRHQQSAKVFQVIFKVILSDCAAKMLDEEIVKFERETLVVVETVHGTVNVSSRY
jgi:hypothetical protein